MLSVCLQGRLLHCPLTRLVTEARAQ
ncbi:hypothetical protein UPYG_G00006210 [Umbra pygmaea]|uniref:Uncharacterized protein n=1 Tax=Umbra pygmaea TaxID=75934 RepID=A0ABD0XHS5_UMBPY